MMMIDAKLIAAHQWLIDVSEKKPNWWGFQVMVLSTCVDIVAKLASWKGGFFDYFLLLLTMCVGAVLTLGARREPFFKSVGNSYHIRLFFLVFICLQVLTLITAPSGVAFLRLVSMVTFVNYYYFAACEGPRPRKRKEKLVLRTT